MGDEDELDGDNLLMSVRERLNNITAYPKSELNRVTCQANFENFVLVTARRNNPYKKFLLSIRNPTNFDTRSISYQRPSHMLINSYLYYMSDPCHKAASKSTDESYIHDSSRQNAYNSVRTRLAAISGTCKEFGLGTLTYRSDTLKLLKKLQGKQSFYKTFSVH